MKGKQQAYSFDIYDTLLVRTVYAPEGIFLLVGEELRRRNLWDGTPEEWTRRRREAEGAARQGSAREIRLDDIRRELSRSLDSGVVDIALALELEIELRCSVGISQTLERVRGLVEAQKDVFYISDMYLPAAHIRRTLEQIGAPALSLHLSCDTGKTKRGGELFDEVVGAPGSERLHLHHVGDNRTADVNVPRKRGLSAEHFIASRPTILERHIHDKIATHDATAATVIAGALKAARLSPPSGLDALQSARWLNATQTGAILHLGFVSWIVEMVRERKPDRVFFLARDGFVPSKLYERLRAADPSLPPASYLYVSRQSLHVASIQGAIENEDRRWILAKTEQLTFGEWLFRLGLERDRDFTAAQIELLALPPSAQRMDGSDQELCRSLLDQPVFRGKVLERAAERRADVVTYLQQEGLMQCDHPCFIDIGWHGRMQRALVKLAQPSAHWQHISGLYLGLVDRQAPEFGDYAAWLFDRSTGRRAGIDGHLDLYEILFSAPHATTFAYVRDEEAGHVRPVLAEWDPLRPTWPDIELALTCLERIQDWIHAALDNARVSRALSSVAPDATYQWMHFPHTQQVFAYSGLKFGSDQINLGKEQLVYPLDDVQCILMLLRIRDRDSTNQWFPGQIASVKSLWARSMVSSYRFLKLRWNARHTKRDQQSTARAWPGHY